MTIRRDDFSISKTSQLPETSETTQAAAEGLREVNSNLASAAENLTKHGEPVNELVKSRVNLGPEGQSSAKVVSQDQSHDRSVGIVFERRARQPIQNDPFRLFNIMTDGAGDIKARLLQATVALDAGLDINAKDEFSGRTVLHLCAGCAEPEIVPFLLSKGADPMAESRAGEPEIRKSDLEGLTPFLTEALQRGCTSEAENCISAVESFLPHPFAASVLAGWTGLCGRDETLSARLRASIEGFLGAFTVSNPDIAIFVADLADRCKQDPKLSQTIHEMIEQYLTTLDGDPPVEVARYVACYNAEYKRDAMATKLQAIGAKYQNGVFTVSKEFSAENDSLLLIKWAKVWVLDPEADKIRGDVMTLVQAILCFVDDNAHSASLDTQAKIHSMLVEIQLELENSIIPEHRERAPAFGDLCKQLTL